jgi:hypothetical protein
MSPVITKFNKEIDKLIKTDTIQSESDIFDYVGLKNIAGKIVNKLGNVHSNSGNGVEGNKLSELASLVYQAKIPTPPAPVEPSNNVGEEVSGRGVGSRRKGKKSSKKKKSKKSKRTKKVMKYRK